MLESIVDYEEHKRKDDGGDKDQHCRTLQLFPSRPGSLLYKLYIALFEVVD